MERVIQWLENHQYIYFTIFVSIITAISVFVLVVKFMNDILFFLSLSTLL